MPILAAQVNLYPEELLDTPFDPQGDRGWQVVYTLARQEKRLMRFLHGREIPFYTPLYAKRNRSSSGRIRTSYLPLLPGYVFLFGTAYEASQAKESKCISQVIRVVDNEQLVSDLSTLRDLIALDVPLSVESRIEAGQRVRICSGPFLGLEGVVIKRNSKTRLVVSIHYIQQSVSVLLEDCEVEPV